MVNNQLYHSGVLGMHWGVRRTDAQIARGTSKKTDNSNRKEDIKNLSDDELRRKVNRLNLEKQYSQLTNSDYVNNGKTYAQKIIKAGTTIAAVTTTALTLHGNAKKIKDIIEKSVSK